MGHLHLVSQLLEHELVGLMEQKPVNLIDVGVCELHQTIDHRRHLDLHEVEHRGTVHFEVILGPEVAVTHVFLYSGFR